MKKIVTILFIIMLFITFIQIRNVYALYKAEITGELQTLLGVWVVKVNEVDISSGAADLTFEITDEYLNFEESEYLTGNYIAPGSEGYFDLLIDPTGTDVSVKYNIQIDNVTKIKVDGTTTELEEPIELELVSFEDTFEKGADKDTTTEHLTNLDTENGIATGVIPLSVISNGYQDRVRVKFKWVNNDSNNEIDSMLAEEGGQIIVPVNVELIQYMGEEI